LDPVVGAILTILGDGQPALPEAHTNSGDSRRRANHGRYQTQIHSPH
jgi:hypothetical protein